MTMEGRMAALTLAAVGSFCGMASAQSVTIASLPWSTSGMSAGPLARDYPAADNAKDIWVVEDFRTDRDWLVDRFSSTGAGSVTATKDVHVVILTNWPTIGTVVMESVPGTGKYVNGSPWGRHEATFGMQRLRKGSYKIMWCTDDGGAGSPPPVMFVKAGSYAVGFGDPDNAYQFNPGGGWNLPNGVLDPVTDDLNNQGNPIGVNFKLTGVEAPPCDADFNGDGFVNGNDYDLFADAFDVADASADLTGDGFVNGDDYDFFAEHFDVGC